MNYFLHRLLPPRANFSASMTPAEHALMIDHVAYWSALMKQGLVIAFGPVADPRGAYGIGVLQLDDDRDAQALAAADPVIAAGIGFSFELHRMPRIVLPENVHAVITR